MPHLFCQAGFAWCLDRGARDLIQYVLVKAGEGKRREGAVIAVRRRHGMAV